MEEHEKKKEKRGEVKKSKPWREEKGENQNGEPLKSKIIRRQFFNTIPELTRAEDP